jgi:hypothetical protein
VFYLNILQTVSRFFKAVEPDISRYVREKGKRSGMWENEKEHKRKLSRKKGVSKEEEKKTACFIPVVDLVH